mmetsp:Transcript_5845/g.18802  ORF Transcript_5845/g.18802 Transcript_5845/m.18802 type:complete len:117 (-) Transcript_5845:17-367(-)
MSTATFIVGNWTAVVRGTRTFAVAGPQHRLDVSFSVHGDYAARNLPHGLFGQSFATASPRYGRVDEYPKSGRISTSAMAEGAIDGNASMYEVSMAYETRFAFSRFDALPEQRLRTV